MKKQKFYFSHFSEDYAHLVEYLIEEMRERNIEEIEVAEAERELNSEYFNCKAMGEVCEKSEGGCGKVCESYAPRNGKSGCCKYRGFIHVPGKEFKLTIDGKLILIKN